eukprot:TRINITY_DN14986_c0_g1_i1.p1 TRINITY_DN14986_c0_g1~~TRINITY_DN14986_c0_g1_i1.p1  ORF type:complete len:214 (+),score=52.87 TRINITY_DN14986_c0_g1_i1:504-1145(+)
MIASHQGNEKIASELLKHSPDINKEDKFGKKASDRAQSNSIFYLLQSAAVEQRIKISEDKVSELTIDCNKDHAKNNKEGGVVEYYRKFFAEKVREMSGSMSEAVQAQLNAKIEQEISKSSDLLRKVLETDINSLNEKIREQINQYINLKIKLVTAHFGIAPTLEPALTPHSTKIQLAVTEPGQYLSTTPKLSLIHICRCRRYAVCRSRWSPYH